MKHIRQSQFSVVVFLAVFVMTGIGLVLAGHVITVATGGTTISANEDVGAIYNISVNNSDILGGINITQVNITLPTTFSFVANSNISSIGPDVVFSNTTTILTWFNETSLVGNNSRHYFQFNASATTPGMFNITVRTLNVTGLFETNISVTINDTTVPVNANYSTLSEVNSTNISRSNAQINITAADNGVLETIFIRLFNASSSLLNSSTITTGVVSLFANFTSLVDGTYYFNATVNDTYGNTNMTATRTFSVDTVVPNITYQAITETNSTNISRTNIMINVTASDVNGGNIRTIFIRLFNASSSLLNSPNQTSPSAAVSANYTGLADGTYYFNATVNDTADNTNVTPTRTITIDTVVPNITYQTITEANSTNISRSNIMVNVTASDINDGNIRTIFIRLYNATLVLNSTVNQTSPQSSAFANFTSLVDGTYYFNASVNDTADNTNMTVIRTVTIDTVVPNITYQAITETNSTNLSRRNIMVNVTVSDVNGGNTRGIIIRVSNSSSAVVNSSEATSGSALFANLTVPRDGVYYFNATVNDTADNFNITQTRAVVIDTTSPSATLTCTPNPVGRDEAITCSCTGSDATSGVQTTTYTTNPATTQTGTFTTTCTATDYAGNSGTGSFEYTVSSSGSGPSGGGGGSSSSSSAAAASGSEWKNTVLFDESELSSKISVSWDLAAKERLRLKLDGEEHHVGVKSVDGNKVLIEVSSVPQEASLAVGENKKFEVNGDDYYDLEVSVKSILNDKATVGVVYLHEVMSPALAPEAVPVDTGVVPDDALQPGETNPIVWIILIIVVLGLVMFVVYWMKKK